MLRAAIAAQLHHPDDVRTQLANIPDPLGDGLLECRDVPGGVELKSKQMITNRPVMLIVGLKDK